MADAKLSAPEHWQDWVSWVLGFWLCISPWALYFEAEPNATPAAVITGLLLIATEAVTLSAYRAWEEWVNVVLGVWLVVAPWLLGMRSPAAIGDFVVVGLLVVALAAYELWQAGRSRTAP
jgi:hypothetical protein